MQCLLMLALACPQTPPPAKPPVNPKVTPKASQTEKPLAWQSEALPNGPTLHVLVVPDASQTGVLTFLPVGLDGDPVGHTQFAHLAEHLMIATTDPGPRSRRALKINGETTHRAMRFESFVSHDKAEIVLQRHARWLQVRRFKPQDLQRKKLMIKRELDNTVPTGSTHKWAAAAWSQIMAGQRHAALRGDIRNATVAQLERYVRGRIDPRQAHIFVTTARAASPLQKVLRKAFRKPAPTTGTEKRPSSNASNSEPADSPASPQPQEGSATQPESTPFTWDLRTHHYLEWYQLPKTTTAAEAEIANIILTTKLFQNKAPILADRRPVSSVVRQGKSFYLLLSASISAPDRLEKIRKALRTSVTGNHELQSLRGMHGVALRRITPIPDFAALKKRIGPRYATMIEPNYAMQCGYACVRLGVSLAEAPQRYRAATRKRVLAVMAAGLTEKSRGTAFLRPRKPQAP